jgi:hypothetical protein
MIEANKNELFPITVSLLDDVTAELVADQIVTYDVRTIDDALLSPPISGSLSESIVEGGIYKTQISLPDSGTYICYAFCDGFVAGTEEIMISNENIYEVTKANRPHNFSIIDVPRATVSGAASASQISRKVPPGRTDYIVTIIKNDDALNWDNPVSSGISYAHYNSVNDELPFAMGGEF